MSNIHRAYHAIQRLSTSAGKPTNAIYGFVTMLRKLLRERSPRLPGGRLGRPPAHRPARGLRPIQGQPPGHGRRPRRSAPRDPPRAGGLPDPGSRDAGLRGGRRDRHPRQQGRGGGSGRRDRHGGQGHAPAGGSARARLPHRPRGLPRRGRCARVLRRRAEPGRRRPGPDGRQRGQHPRSPRSRAGHGQEVDLVVREPGKSPREDGRDSRKGRREPSAAPGGRPPLAAARRDPDRSADRPVHGGAQALRHPTSRSSRRSSRSSSSSRSPPRSRERRPLRRPRPPGGSRPERPFRSRATRPSAPPC